MALEGARSGCQGRGRLLPHSTGEYNVYDVELVIDQCNAPYVYLNATMTGLATRTTGMDWGDWLVLWMSSAESDHAALTMWNVRSDACEGCWDY